MNKILSTQSPTLDCGELPMKKGKHGDGGVRLRPSQTLIKAFSLEVVCVTQLKRPPKERTPVTSKRIVTMPTVGIKARASYLVAALRVIENNIDWVNKIINILHSPDYERLRDSDKDNYYKKLEQINFVIDQQMGHWVVLKNIEMLPSFMKNSLLTLPELVLEKYNEAKKWGEEKRFLEQYLGAGDLCLEDVQKRMLAYAPRFFDKIDPFPAQCNTPQLQLAFVHKQHNQRCIKAYESWYGVSAENGLAAGYLISSYAPESISYQRGLYQLLMKASSDSLYNLDTITQFMIDEFGLDTEEKKRVVIRNRQELIQERWVRQELGIRVEALTTQDVSMDTAGMDRTLAKIVRRQASNIFPVVNVGESLPVITYVRRFMYAGLVLVMDEDQHYMASKVDFCSNRILQVIESDEYHHCQSDAQRSAYIERALGLKPYSLIIDPLEWEDKKKELALKARDPEGYKSSKYALNKLDNDRLNQLIHDPSLVNGLLEQYKDSEEDCQLRNALRRVSRLDADGRRHYIEKATGQGYPMDVDDDTLQEMATTTPAGALYAPLVHNECLVTGARVENIQAVYLDLSLPGTYSQAKRLQKIVEELQAGDGVPLMIYDPRVPRLYEIPIALLDEFAALLEHVKECPEKSTDLLDEFLKNHEGKYNPLRDILGLAIDNYLMKYYMSRGEWPALNHFFEAKNFIDNQLLQLEFMQIMEGLLRQDTILRAVVPRLNEILPYFKHILEAGNARAKMLVTDVITTIADSNSEIDITREFVTLLVTLLNNASMTDFIKQSVVQVILTIANGPRQEEIIQNDDIVRGLVALLNDTSAMSLTKQNAVLAIAAIAKDARGQEKINQDAAELVHGCVRLLNDMNATMIAKKCVALILVTMSFHPETLQKMIQAENLVSSLLTILSGVGAPDLALMKEHAAQILAAIAVAGTEGRMKILQQENLIGCLNALLADKNATPRAREYVNRVWCIMCAPISEAIANSKQNAQSSLQNW